MRSFVNATTRLKKKEKEKHFSPFFSRSRRNERGRLDVPEVSCFARIEFR